MIQEVQFLGHFFNQEGIMVDPAKVEVFLQCDLPNIPSDIRSFIGLAGYY